MMQPASPLSVGSLTQLTLSLIAVVALIVGLSWALKRLRVGVPRGRSRSAASGRRMTLGLLKALRPDSENVRYGRAVGRLDGFAHFVRL